MSVEALKVLVVTLSCFVMAVNLLSVVFAIRVHRRHMRILQVRPIGRAIFMGMIVVTGAQTLEIIYLTTLYLGRASYAVSTNTGTGLPSWVQSMATGQYFVYYGESLLAPIVLIIVAWGISQMPKHHGPFGNLPLDPRDLTDDQIDDWSHAMHTETASRARHRKTLKDFSEEEVEETRGEDD